MSVTIRNSERVALLGATGSGKTQLAKYLLSNLNRVIVIDPKFTFKLDGFRKSWTLPAFNKSFRLLVRPARHEDERLATFLYKLQREGRVTIYVDEMATLSEMFPESTKILADIARTGREKKVALWSSMQRPRNTPRIFLTESEVFFIFNLRSGDDRDYMVEYAGDVVSERIPKYEFWYLRADDDNDPARLMLDLAQNKLITKGG